MKKEKTNIVPQSATQEEGLVRSSTGQETSNQYDSEGDNSGLLIQSKRSVKIQNKNADIESSLKANMQESGGTRLRLPKDNQENLVGADLAGSADIMSVTPKSRQRANS